MTLVRTLLILEAFLLCPQHVDVISEGQASIAQKLFEEALIEGHGDPQLVVEYLRKVVLK